MSNIDAFLPFAAAEVAAEQMMAVLTENDRQHLLLWKAYLKRIKPVPSNVLRDAIKTFNAAEGKSLAVIETIQIEQLTMDKLGDLLWNQLDEATAREWLLKAV